MESDFPFRADNLRAYIRYNNFSCKMTRNYERNYDKENSSDADSFLSGRTRSTNNELRKKMQQNLVLIQRNHSNAIDQREDLSKAGDSQCLNVSRKREHGRRRGFDMKISNIDSINEKITGLLNMVRKDKQAERIDTMRQRKNDTNLREIERSPISGLKGRMRIIDGSNKRTERIEREETPISRFGDACLPQRKKELIEAEFPRRQDRIKEKTMVEEEKGAESSNIRAVRIKLLQQEERIRQKSRENYTRREIKPQQINTQQERLYFGQTSRYPLTKEVRAKNNIQNDETMDEQKRAIDKMLEDRRRQRIMMRELERQKSQKKIAPKNEQNLNYKVESQATMSNGSELQIDSPILKGKTGQFYNQLEDNFKNIQTPLSKNFYDVKDYSRFAEVSYIQEQPNSKNKISCTAQLIDEQLIRIKSKINESETNKKKIESLKSAGGQSYKGKEHTSRIADSLKSQVQVDNHLKQARQSFQKMTGQNKWSQLEAMIKKRGLNLESRTLKELITIGPDEHNPFGSERSSVQLQQIAELLCSAQKNWQNCVLKCASMKSLKNECFEVSDLDLNNKGYLGPQDLVCFVNLYSNTFYRNRDLALVMRRLQILEESGSRMGIEYQTFLEAFAA